MAFLYTKRTRYLYDPKSSYPFRLSRSKIDLFIKCPRCFYLDRRLGIGQPQGPPFTLNSAVDKLLKKEFDIHRAKNKTHPLMKTYNINAVPFSHPQINLWRENFKGITYLHKSTNLMITGAIDDLWVNPEGEIHIVDYKSTSKEEEITLDEEWKDTYKRQAEVYQWLFRKNDFKVSNIAYFVYCNGNTQKEMFDSKLEFKVTILPYEGSDGWVEETINQAYNCLISPTVPKISESCEYCQYSESIIGLSKPVKKIKALDKQPKLFD